MISSVLKENGLLIYFDLSMVIQGEVSYEKK